MLNERRVRWAQRENARLAAGHQKALAAWRQDGQTILWYLEQAKSARPLSPPLGVKLRRNERVLWTAANVSLVEVPEFGGLFTPVHEVYSPTRDTGGYLPLSYGQNSVRDNGFVAITDLRVLFVGGRANREWTFADLDGVAHGAQVPMTVMRVGNRQRLSGLVFSSDEAPAFQFYLSVAFADHRRDRAGFVAHLTNLLQYHRMRPPPAPAPADPAQAPSMAKLLGGFYFGPSGAPAWRKLTPALVTIVGLICLGGALLAPPQGREATPADRQAPAALATSSPAATPSPTPVESTPAAPLPAPRTPTSPKPVNLCGAPKNPWNFNFCGGSTITDPPDDFCSYFDCIDNFWKGVGYVIQCKDNMFSQSGGRQGSCSYHGGNRRSLYR
jgi:hypothetical protein